MSVVFVSRMVLLIKVVSGVLNLVSCIFLSSMILLIVLMLVYRLVCGLIMVFLMLKVSNVSKSMLLMNGSWKMVVEGVFLVSVVEMVLI